MFRLKSIIVNIFSKKYIGGKRPHFGALERVQTPYTWDTTVNRYCHLHRRRQTCVSGSAREAGTAAKMAALRGGEIWDSATKSSFPASCGITGDRGRSDFVIFDRAGSHDLGIIWRQSWSQIFVPTRFCCCTAIRQLCFAPENLSAGSRPEDEL